MIRWQKIRTVASFEFLSTVKRTGYLVTTFGMPLFMAAYGAVVAVPAYYARQKDKAPALFGVVDSGKVLALSGDTSASRSPVPEEVRRALESVGQGAALDNAMVSSNYVFRPFDSEPQARQALAARAIKGYFDVSPDYMSSGRVDVYTPDSFTMSGSTSRDAFAAVMRERLVAGRMDDASAARVITPLNEDTTRRFAVTRNGDIRDGSEMATGLRLAVPILFTVLFLMSVLMTSGYLLQGTAVEKENKVVEVLVASANPDEILGGKLVGLGGAGLLQIGVWLLIVVGFGVSAVPMLLASGIEIPWNALALAIPLFLVAFLFFGSLMLGTGSFGSTMRESQQLAMVWSITAAFPLITMSTLIREPHGTVARVLTWLPFTSGSMIMMRASMDPAFLAWWEVAGALLVLIVSTWFAIRLGARLFRVGLLSSGARPSIREIIRQARLAA